jgi:hypothetical protein
MLLCSNRGGHLTGERSLWLDWAGDPGYSLRGGKSFSSCTEGEAGFASDCSCSFEGCKSVTAKPAA